MKKTLASAAVVLLSLAGTGFAAEFQPIGALGIGGAGVARTNNGLAGHWNPAGLAFNERTFSVPLAVSVGLRVSDGLADNVDKLSKFTEEGPGGTSALDNLTNIGDLTADQQKQALGDIVSLLAVIKDIETQKGTISLTGSAALAVQVKHFAFGVFGTLEGFAKPDVDTVNVLPENGGGALDATEIADLAAGATDSRLFFDDPTRTSLITSLTPTFGGTGATNIVNALDAELSSGGTVSVTPQQVADILQNTLIPALTPSTDPNNTSSIDDNRTSVLLKSFAYAEFPISYGHPISLGKYGRLGLGASIKPIRGRVYSSVLRLVTDDSVESGDVTDNLTKNFEESTSITVDLGAFYKYGTWLNVGLVGKNLTSPKFKSPELKDQDGVLVTTDAQGRPVAAPKDVTLKPQVRLGVAIDALSWLTFAADLDLTENETVLASSEYKSRHLGGGVEIHPLTWLKARAGMYKNLSNDDVGPVATAGLTFGTKWVNLELDGAYGLETAKYDEKDYPKELRVQTSLNIQF